MTDLDRVRQPAVAGLFYPGDAAELAAAVRAYLELGTELGAGLDDLGPPRALIAPHAGYRYSGEIAGSAFARLAGGSGKLRVVLLGPAHRLRLSGLALPDAEALATPLGEVEVDGELARRALAQAPVTVEDRAHAGEHSLEVELPFLQLLADELTVLPLVVGVAAPTQVAAVLDAVWDGDDVCVVVSSDLSHYLPYGAARAADRATAERILAGDATLGPEDACGAAPINGLLRSAARRGFEARAIDLRNSGDTAGGSDRVVGYGAFAFYPP